MTSYVLLRRLSVNNERGPLICTLAATYLAFFSVTYLATSLKLAKFSVTERTAALTFAGLPGTSEQSECVPQSNSARITDPRTILTIDFVIRADKQQTTRAEVVRLSSIEPHYVCEWRLVFGVARV